MKDIAKKILIGVVILEIIIIIISAVIIIKSKYFIAEENIESQFKEIAEVEEIEEQVQNEENNSNTIVEEEEITIEDKIGEDNSTEQMKIDEPKTTVQSQVVQNNKNSENPFKTTSKNTNTNNNTNKSNSTSVQTTIETNTKKEENNNPQTIVQNNNTSSNTETQKVPETPKTNTVTYKYNENMTNKMISVIKANESDYMKEYGYTVVVDESIITLTNQFTYSDQRVKDKLTYKFGQIRVYARDYFVNGEYKWTECYII